MARRMLVANQVLYRAVFTVTYDDPDGYDGRISFTDALGPYMLPGSASAALKAADASWQWYHQYHDNVTVTGRVEKTSTNWEEWKP